MANFEYIRDERFRLGLEADYAEMNAALGARAWKAVHVLAGSIVEAVLIDYLLEAAEKSTAPAPSRDLLKIELGEAIDACKDAGVLSEKTAALSHVVRSYRNLIHPGRIVRLGESVDEQGARVAVALTEMVVAEVGQARGDNLGYTAEQLATKIEGDPDTASLLQKHFLPKLTEAELEKLLLRVLPERYLTEAQAHGPGTSSAKALADSYRRTLAKVPEALQRRAAEWFARVVRKQPASIVHFYQEAFFRAPHLSFYADDDAVVVVDYLLSRLVSQRSEALLSAASGIGPWLTPAQTLTAVDAVAREVSWGDDIDLDTASREWLLAVVKGLQPRSLAAAKARHTHWVAMFENQEDHPRAAQLTDLLTASPVLDELPS
ncbi:MAG: hypothetical protein ABSD62_07240 [Candidatus Limnocylindrales bacterium]|jgi:hypothetical protein